MLLNINTFTFLWQYLALIHTILALPPGKPSDDDLSYSRSSLFDSTDSTTSEHHFEYGEGSRNDVPVRIRKGRKYFGLGPSIFHESLQSRLRGIIESKRFYPIRHEEDPSVLDKEELFQRMVNTPAFNQNQSDEYELFDAQTSEYITSTEHDGSDGLGGWKLKTLRKSRNSFVAINENALNQILQSLLDLLFKKNYYSNILNSILNNRSILRLQMIDVDLKRMNINRLTEPKLAFIKLVEGGVYTHLDNVSLNFELDVGVMCNGIDLSASVAAEQIGFDALFVPKVVKENYGKGIDLKAAFQEKSKGHSINIRALSGEAIKNPEAVLLTHSNDFFSHWRCPDYVYPVIPGLKKKNSQPIDVKLLECNDEEDSKDWSFRPFIKLTQPEKTFVAAAPLHKNTIALRAIDDILYIESKPQTTIHHVKVAGMPIHDKSSSKFNMFNSIAIKLVEWFTDTFVYDRALPFLTKAVMEDTLEQLSSNVALMLVSSILQTTDDFLKNEYDIYFNFHENFLIDQSEMAITKKFIGAAGNIKMKELPLPNPITEKEFEFWYKTKSYKRWNHGVQEGPVNLQKDQPSCVTHEYAYLNWFGRMIRPWSWFKHYSNCSGHEGHGISEKKNKHQSILKSWLEWRKNNNVLQKRGFSGINWKKLFRRKDVEFILDYEHLVVKY